MLLQIKKEVLKKYTELWDGIKYLIKITNAGEAVEYEKEYMKISFNWDVNLPLNKILKLYILVVIVRFVFQEDVKYFPKVFLGECLHES